jgi:hypothetical protein
MIVSLLDALTRSCIRVNSKVTMNVYKGKPLTWLNNGCLYLLSSNRSICQHIVHLHCQLAEKTSIKVHQHKQHSKQRVRKHHLLCIVLTKLGSATHPLDATTFVPGAHVQC